MGIRAVYIALDDKEVTELEKLLDQKLLKEVEKIQKKGDCTRIDIDKMWDILHFILTGNSASEPIEDNKLSEFVVGVSPILYEDEYISFSPQEDVAEIVEKVKNIDFDIYRDSFRIKDLSEKDIYPNVGVSLEEEEFVFEEVKKEFYRLSNFYNENKGVNILVTIY
ncbi:DUF1877 family protein [Bernardetia sp.]|uniref:DUF1877 family protein n=1 Tax=Bernardetia sp. TaxID=1937974 RepID=UPI0025BC3B6C|nr:DUF1877 family protein [Bernardetia sp.]